MDEWSSSLGHALVYGFFEPQSIHHAKDQHAECEHYIQTWLKESQRKVYLEAYLNQYVVFIQMLVKKNVCNICS